MSRNGKTIALNAMISGTRRVILLDVSAFIFSRKEHKGHKIGEGGMKLLHPSYSTNGVWPSMPPPWTYTCQRPQAYTCGNGDFTGDIPTLSRAGSLPNGELRLWSVGQLW